MIYDPAAHESLTDARFDRAGAEAFVVDTVRILAAAYDPDRGWQLHPEDDYGDPEGAVNQGVYFGTAGSLWALWRLAERYDIGLPFDCARAIERCEEQFERFPAEERTPSYLLGLAGIAFVRYLVTNDVGALDRYRDAAARNVDNPTREYLWGAPGTVVPALLLREHTGDRRFDPLIRVVQEELWKSWDAQSEDASFLWLQELYGHRRRFVGAGHGAISNIAVFVRALDLLHEDRRPELALRLRTMLERYAIIDGRAVNWYGLGTKGADQNRTQWCHGAPGIITSLTWLEPTDDTIEDLLCRGGNGIWQAGPLKKGPTLCHGTAGNGFAFLELARRTGDEMWQDRAQRFAAHAIEQTRQWHATFGMPSASLWTGDAGVALYVDAVLRDDSRILSNGGL